MKIKTSEATPLQINWAVAKCEGVPNVHTVTKPGKTCVYGEIVGVDFPYQPSTDWAQGGPIIEREQFQLAYAIDNSDDPDQPWVCDDYAGQVPSGVYWGTTALIAAMRCYVASKLGDEVDVPEELV